MIRFVKLNFIPLQKWLLSFIVLNSTRSRSVFALPQVSQLYYDGNTGFYYYYDAESGRYQFHSKVEVTAAVVEDQNAGDKKGRKFKKWVNKSSNEDSKVSNTCLFKR